jgi:hypothetical protein
MNPDASSTAKVPETVYMVEAYRAAGDAPPGSSASPADPEAVVLGVIDVPGDEVALFLIAAPNAATADRVVRDGGGRPIRVVPVRWDVAPGGNPPMLTPATDGTLEP